MQPYAAVVVVVVVACWFWASSGAHITCAYEYVKWVDSQSGKSWQVFAVASLLALGVVGAAFVPCWSFAQGLFCGGGGLIEAGVRVGLAWHCFSPNSLQQVSTGCCGMCTGWVLDLALHGLAVNGLMVLLFDIIPVFIMATPFPQSYGK